MNVGSALERISRSNVLRPNVCAQMSRAQMSGFVYCRLVGYHAKAIKALLRARLGVASHLSTTARWGNSVKCLFQLHK